MPERFTRIQAAQALGIGRRTLYTWLAPLKLPKRSLLTKEQVQQLAQAHGRTLPTSPAQDTSDLAHRLATLESKMEAMEALLSATLVTPWSVRSVSDSPAAFPAIAHS